jgi:O-antigen/teichoic acid export membrane protein
MITKQKISHIKNILTLGTLNKILVVLVGYVSISALTTLLGKERFGDFLFFQAAFAYIVIISIFGFDKTIVYRIASTKLSEQTITGKPVVLKLARISILLNLFLDLAILASTLIYSDKPVSESLFWVISIGINSLFLVIFSFFQALFEANMKAKISLKISCLGNFLKLFSLFALLFIDAEANTTILVFLLVPSISSIVLAYRDSKKYANTETEPPSLNASDYKYSATMMFTKASFLVSEKADLIFIGLLMSSIEVANYAVAAKLAIITTIGNDLLNPIISPRLKSKISFGSYSELAHEYNFIRYFSLCFALLSVSLLATFGESILTAFGGYQDSYALLLLLSLAMLNKVAFGPNGRYLMLSGHATNVLKASLLSASVLITLNLILIPIYGVLGSAIATYLALLLLNIGLDFYLALVVRIRFLNWLDYAGIAAVNLLILHLTYNLY